MKKFLTCFHVYYKYSLWWQQFFIRFYIASRMYFSFDNVFFQKIREILLYLSIFLSRCFFMLFISIVWIISCFIWKTLILNFCFFVCLLLLCVENNLFFVIHYGNFLGLQKIFLRIFLWNWMEVQWIVAMNCARGNSDQFLHQFTFLRVFD